MKKIILFIVILLGTCGCYDYQEINNMAIIVGIGIDYQNEEYQMTYEILNIQKNNESGSQPDKSYTVTGNGKTITEVVVNAETKIAKKASFSHLQLMLIGNNLATHGISDMADYFLRNNKITNNFYMVLCNNVTPEQVLGYKSKSEQINTTAIFNLLKTDNTNISIDTKDQFDYQMAKLKENMGDIIIPSITINKEIDASNLAVFKGDKFKYYLSNEEEQTYGLILRKIKNNSITDDIGTIEVNHNKSGLDYKDDKVNINIQVLAKLERINDSEIKLKNNDDLAKLENSFISNIEERINYLLTRAKDNDCDILGAKKVIYLSKPNTDLNKDIEYQIKINLHINRGGSLYEELT